MDKKQKEHKRERIRQMVAFADELELLKSIERTAWSSCGRRESTAEHSWRVALLAGLFAMEQGDLDLNKVLLMSLVHDLGEIYEGDLCAAAMPDQEKKEETERRAMQKLLLLSPPELGKAIQQIWEEYEKAQTKEARFVKAMDKGETILQHCRGMNPPDFDYAFNLEYGREYFGDSETLRVFREIIDEKTRSAMEKQKK